LSTADLVVGAVLIPGKKAPKLVLKDDLSLMKKGSVVVDVAVDQGGCIETTHATTHVDPVYDVDGIIHYCVANMPGAVARTATQALTNTTLVPGLKLANEGVEKAIKGDEYLRCGVNTYKGKVTYAGVAEAWDLPCTDVLELI
jgi:alanine dehydrogenase